MTHDQTRDAREWKRQLAGNSDQQVTALRQIASRQQAHGLAAHVVSLAGSSDDEVRMWAAEALENAVQPTSGELLALIRLLGETGDSEVSYWAATLIGRLGGDAAPAVTALQQCVTDCEYLAARERAVWALTQIGPRAEDALPALRGCIGSAPPRLSRLAQAAVDAISKQRQADRSEGAEEAAA